MRHSCIPTSAVWLSLPRPANLSRVGTGVRRRLVQIVQVLFGVSVLTWGLTWLAPGDAAEIYARQYAENGRPSPAEISRARVALHLDGNVAEQYINWLGRVVRGDLGRSFSTGRTVVDDLRSRLPATMHLAAAAMVFLVILGLSVGVCSALWKDRLGDSGLRLVAVVGGAIPSFWLLLLLIRLFSVQWHLLPSFGRGSGIWSNNVILPAVSLGLVHVGATARLTRSSMVDALNQEYVRAARARGVSQRRVITAHAFRNTLPPVLTQLGLTLGGMLGGAVIVETVYSWPGIGKLATDAISAKDYPVLQGTVLMSALVYLAVGTILEVVCAWADPRISSESVGS